MTKRAPSLSIEELKLVESEVVLRKSNVPRRNAELKLVLSKAVWLVEASLVLGSAESKLVLTCDRAESKLVLSRGSAESKLVLTRGSAESKLVLSPGSALKVGVVS